jgi:hypothetical protein
MRLRTLFIWIFMVFFCATLFPKNKDSLLITNKTEKYFYDKIDYVKAEQQAILTEALQKQKRFERKLLRKLKKVDKTKYAQAKAIIAERKTQYEQIKAKGNDLSNKAQSLGAYVPLMDTVMGAVKYLEKGQQALDGKMGEALKGMEGVEEKFQASSQVISSLNGYNERLLTAFSDVKGISQLMDKHLAPIKNYTAMLNDLRSVYKNPELFETKLLKHLQDIPFLKDYIAEHGELAQIFKGQSSLNDPARIQAAPGASANLNPFNANTLNAIVSNAGANTNSANPLQMPNSAKDMQSIIHANNNRPHRQYDNIQQAVKAFKQPVKPYFNLAIRGYEKWYPNAFDLQAGVNIKNKYKVLFLTYVNARYVYSVQQKQYRDLLIPALAAELGYRIENTLTISAGSMYNLHHINFINQHQNIANKDELVFAQKRNAINTWTYFTQVSLKILQIKNMGLNMGLRYEGIGLGQQNTLQINLHLTYEGR